MQPRCSALPLKRKTKIISTFILLVIFTKLWVGVYEHDEFSHRIIFIKHRPVWKTFFYSPRGMSDLKISEMSAEKQFEQKLFDEFVLKKLEIE